MMIVVEAVGDTLNVSVASTSSRQKEGGKISFARVVQVPASWAVRGLCELCVCVCVCVCV